MNIGDRMKGYEHVSDFRLPQRFPLIIRLDGNSFSKFTNKLKLAKPFDDRMFDAMSAGALAALEYISGAQVAYTQSDEITILVRNDQTHATTPFLDNRIQKICSLIAGHCTNGFNRKMRELGFDTDAVFDARVFIVPHYEVNNVFVWRQFDAFKNFVSSYAYWELAKKYGKKTAFKMLDGLNTSDRQELVFKELGVNCNDLPTHWKRGFCISRERVEVSVKEVIKKEAVYEELLAKGKIKEGQMTFRTKVFEDREIPRFDKDVDYINQYMAVSEDVNS